MNGEDTILAVDDTSESLALLVTILAPTGCTVRLADSGELALAAVAANPPDLILLDVRMKGMDGLEVCRRLKARDETRDIPVILISAFADVAEWVEGLHLGAADYITKPFHAQELLTRVATHLALGRANASLRQQAAALRGANEELQSLAARNGALLRAIPDIIMEVGNDKVYRWANLAGMRFFGEDVIGQEAARYFVGEQDTYERVRPLFTGDENTVYLESWQRRRDGEKRLLAWWCRVLRGPDGSVTGALSTARDITAERLTEEQLRQAQKMETVGQLAGGVAHDFNNMLQVITSYAEMALGKVEVGQPLHKYLGEIRRAAQRSAEITGQLLAFARRQTVSPKVLDLNEALAGTQKMIQRLIGEDIELAWLPGHDLWKVKIDPSQLDQVLTNLAVNARDAIGGVGKLTAETGNVRFDEAYCAAHVGFVPGEYVLLAVSDDGQGMDRETMSHLFEPFFTTKEQGKGTGLGLATVYGIVKQNNGFINVYSEPGEGSTFRIYLPRAAGETAEAEGVEAEATVSRGGTETVLVVEDEAAILALAKESLEELGYTVLVASSPEEAMRQAGEREGLIDLLITDVVMPGMNGRQLAERLGAARPGLKCLYMSGYTANVIAHRGVLEEGVSFIGKPFSLTVLADKVREVLDG